MRRFPLLRFRRHNPRSSSSVCDGSHCCHHHHLLDAHTSSLMSHELSTSVVEHSKSVSMAIGTLSKRWGIVGPHARSAPPCCQQRHTSRNERTSERPNERARAAAERRHIARSSGSEPSDVRGDTRAWMTRLQLDGLDGVVRVRTGSGRVWGGFGTGLGRFLYGVVVAGCGLTVDDRSYVSSDVGARSSDSDSWPSYSDTDVDCAALTGVHLYITPPRATSARGPRRWARWTRSTAPRRHCRRRRRPPPAPCR